MRRVRVGSRPRPRSAKLVPRPMRRVRRAHRFWWRRRNERTVALALVHERRGQKGATTAWSADGTVAETDRTVADRTMAETNKSVTRTLSKTRSSIPRTVTGTHTEAQCVAVSSISISLGLCLSMRPPSRVLFLHVTAALRRRPRGATAQRQHRRRRAQVEIVHGTRVMAIVRRGRDGVGVLRGARLQLGR